MENYSIDGKIKLIVRFIIKYVVDSEFSWGGCLLKSNKGTQWNNFISTLGWFKNCNEIIVSDLCTNKCTKGIFVCHNDPMFF